MISLKSGQLNVGNPDAYTGATAISVSCGMTVNAIDGAISAYDNITLADGAQIKFDVNNQRPRLRGLLL